MTFEEWFETPEAEHLDYDHAKIAWRAAWQRAAEAQRESDARLWVGIRGTGPKIRANPLVTAPRTP
jgi:hypothetical protein